MTSEIERIDVYDKKYTLIMDPAGLRAERYGEPWRDLTGDGLVLALGQEILDLKAKLADCDTAHNAETVLRKAAEAQTINAEKAYSTVYRRATLAEAGLEPFDNAYVEITNMRARGHRIKEDIYCLRLEAIDGLMASELTSEVKLNAIIIKDLANAYKIRRQALEGGDLQNYEDFIRNRRQEQALRIAKRLFGHEYNEGDEVTPETRALRHLEEAIELYQAVIARTTLGLKRAVEYFKARETAWRLVQYVFNRPPGDVRQEIGGVSFTLMCLAEALKESVCLAEKDEMTRIQDPAFRSKTQEKRDAGF